jgi:hypothetical protein
VTCSERARAELPGVIRPDSGPATGVPASTGVMGAQDLSRPTEAQTREEIIDRTLGKAAWDLSNPDHVGAWIPVDRFSPEGWQALEDGLRLMAEAGPAYYPNPAEGVGNYMLCHSNGECVAVVEPKHE